MCRQPVRTDREDFREPQVAQCLVGVREVCGSGVLGLYKAVETDAHSCRAAWEMFTTQTHSSPPDTPCPGLHSADSINSHRNVFRPSWRKRATVPVYTRLSWMRFRG